MLWDRAEEGRFPESKELKQVVRDVIKPGLFLGHSDDGDPDRGEEDPGTGRTAFQRLLSVVLGDRKRRNDPRTADDEKKDD